MSVEDPLEEEKREKPTPRSTPLYYLLAFIFTLTIGTASFLAGKWSVDSAGVEAGGNSLELYTASSGGLHGGGSSATTATTTAVTIPPPPQLPTSATTEAATAHSSAEIVEITQTAEWIFAEILSTTAGKPSADIPTTVPAETKTENATEETVTGSTPGDGTLGTTSETTETTTESMSTTSSRFDTTTASTTTEDPPGTETGTSEADNGWTSASELFVETRSPPALSTTEDPEDRSGTTVTATPVVPDTSTTATEGPASTVETTTLRAAEATTPSPTTTTTTDDPAAVTTDCPPEVDGYSATTEDGWPLASWPRPVPDVMRIWPPRNRYRDRQMWKKMREARREMNDMLKLFNRFLHDTDDLFE